MLRLTNAKGLRAQAHARQGFHTDKVSDGLPNDAKHLQVTVTKQPKRVSQGFLYLGNLLFLSHQSTSH